MSPTKTRRHASDTYTPEIAEAICQRLADGEGLAAICSDANMPPRRTVRDWVAKDWHGFGAIYARARQEQYEGWVEEILEISDDAALDPNDRRIRVDSRKWLLSKLLPKQYGDKIEVNATISRDPGELSDIELARIAAEGASALKPGNPPLLEHQPSPTHNLTHDHATAGGNGTARAKSGPTTSG